MGNPAGPGKQYCTSCGELIDRDSRYCTYCGEATKDRAFPTDRSGPATASDDRSLGRARGPGPARSESGRDHGPPAEYGHGRGERYDRRVPREPGREREKPRRDYKNPRVGVEAVDDPRWGESPWRTVGAAAGIGVLGIVVFAVASIVGGIPLFLLGAPLVALFLVSTAIGQYVGFLGLALVYLRRRGYDWARVKSYLGVRLPTLKELGIVVLGLVVIYVLLIVVSLFAEAFLPEPAEGAEGEIAEFDPSPALLVGLVAFMFLVVGPCEEILFRGIVQNRLRERLPAIPSILIASFVFAIVHIVALTGGDIAAMATTIFILFVPAIVFGVVYEYTGNLVVPSLLHGLYNTIVVIVVLYGPELEENAALLASLPELLPV